MDPRAVARMSLIALSILVLIIQGSQTVSGIQDIVTRAGPNQEPDVTEETGSDIYSAIDGQDTNSAQSKREMERRGKKKSDLVHKWVVYNKDGKPMTVSIKSLCLAGHRFARKQHIKNDKISYKNSLAKDAERWAKHLADTGRFEHEKGLYRDFGENVYKLDSNHGLLANPANAIKSWYSESEFPKPKGSKPKNYDYDFNPTTTYTIERAGVGHFSQVIWDKSTSIGCGAATTTYKRGIVEYRITIIVTRYLVPGNQVDTFPQHVFPLRKKATALKDFRISKLFPGKKECIDAMPAEVCTKWKRILWCDRDWAMDFCECTCTQ